jgi:hypothetical protein
VRAGGSINNFSMQGKLAPQEFRDPRLFSDRSIWERRDIKNEDNLKLLMRNGMKYNSIVYVTVEKKTWNSCGAKYEIARSVVEKKGLVAVHINSLNHNHRQTPDRLGVNPIHMISIPNGPEMRVPPAAPIRSTCTEGSLPSAREQFEPEVTYPMPV